MNYKIIYDQIITRAQNRTLSDYTEKHHIIPSCLDGDNKKTNLVELTPEEHFLCHVLLVKMYPTHYGLLNAVNNMCRGHKGRRTRKMYGWLKRKFSEAQSQRMSGKGNSNFGTKWIHCGIENKKIKLEDPIPEGWELGRQIKEESDLITSCAICSNSFIRKKNTYPKRCMNCRHIRQKKTSDVEILAALLSEKSLHSAMKSLCVNPTGSNYTRARNIAKDNNLEFDFKK